jgi:hypothetical protein
MLALVYKFLGALSVVAYSVESLETKYSYLRSFRLFNSEQRECGITNLFDFLALTLFLFFSNVLEAGLRLFSPVLQCLT